MKVVDWRDVSAETVQSLLLAERRRVLESLHWDLAPSFRLVEQARQRGDVPGLVLYEGEDDPAGWAYYVLANRLLQIGGVRASSARGIRSLLDAVLTSPEAELAHGVTCFMEAASGSLASALVRLRFDLHTHQYLEAPVASVVTTAVSSNVATVRPLGGADTPALVRLLARSYAGEPTARAFAPNGRLEEWAHYLGQLLSGPSVGTWRPEQSFAALDASGQLVAVIITTEVARGIAHVAQIAVDPAARGRGLARTLLAAAATAATAAGAKRVTLIVHEENAVARRLYDAAGFTQRGTFLQGARGPVPRRVGGVTIRATGRLSMTA